MSILGSALGGVLTNVVIPTVTGVNETTAKLFRFALKLGGKVRHIDQNAAQEMVDLMRARVPRDTGRLYNGIDYQIDGDTISVHAEAHKSGRYSQEDYARFVEFGTRAGVRGQRTRFASDAGFFSSDAFPEAGFRGTPTARTRSVYRTHPGTKAQPFFFNSAHEVLDRRGIDAEDAIAQAGAEEDLT